MNLLQTMMQNFANAQIGESPTAASDAFTQLQNSINTRYDTQQKAFEADPANAGKAYTLPSPTERMRDEVYGMIQSRNPTLMKQGFELLNDYYQRSTENPADKVPMSMREFELAQSNPEYAKYLIDKEQRGGTRVDVRVGGPSNAEYMPKPNELKELVMPDGSDPPLGKTFGELQSLGARFKKSEQQRAAGSAGAVLEKATRDFGDSISVQESGKGEAFLNELRTRPGLLGELADAGLNMAGINMKPEAVRFMVQRQAIVSQTIKLMSGASATDQEKEDYRRMLPKFNEPLETQMIKYQQAQDFADAIIAENRKAGITSQPVSKGTDRALNNATQPKQPERVKMVWGAKPNG